MSSESRSCSCQPRRRASSGICPVARLVLKPTVQASCQLICFLSPQETHENPRHGVASHWFSPPPPPKKKEREQKKKKMPVRTRANPRILPADVWFIPSFPPWAKGKPPSSFRPNLDGTDLNEFNPSGNQWNPLMRKQANLRIPMPSRKSERQNAKYTSMRDFSVPQHPESCPTATEADLCSCLFFLHVDRTWLRPSRAPSIWDMSNQLPAKIKVEAQGLLTHLPRTKKRRWLMYEQKTSMLWLYSCLYTAYIYIYIYYIHIYIYMQAASLSLVAVWRYVITDYAVHMDTFDFPLLSRRPLAQQLASQQKPCNRQVRCGFPASVAPFCFSCFVFLVFFWFSGCPVALSFAHMQDQGPTNCQFS